MKKLINILIFLISGNSFQTQAQKQGQDLIDSLVQDLPKATEDTNKVNLLFSRKIADEEIDCNKIINL